MTSHSLEYAQDLPSEIVYTLLELPDDLLALVEAADSSSSPALVIKGQADDDAVLCTADKTHALRACVNSNSLLLCRPAAPRWDEDDEDAPPGQGTTVEVITTLHQTLECTVTRPRVERLDDLLGDYLWKGEDEERPSKRIRRYSRADVAALVQASEAELEAALDEQRILEVDGYMRRASPQILSKYLSALLATFNGNALDHAAFDFDSTAALFADEADLAQTAAGQILRWFSRAATDRPGLHELDIRAIAKEVGIALLESWQHVPGKPGAARHNRIPLKAFEKQWRESVTDAHAQGHHLYHDVPEPHLISVPAHSLPLEPQARFAHLFSLRQKWLPEEMTPFLTSISINQKERDRWALKYCRIVKVAGGKGGGVLWVSRTAPTA